MNNAEKTIQNFKEYLKSTKHNCAAQTIAGSYNGFFIEVLTPDKYHIEVSVDEALSLVTLKAYSVKVNAADLLKQAQIKAVELSDRIKAGAYGISSTTGELYYKISTSILENPADGEVLAQLEELSIRMLSSVEDQFLKTDILRFTKQSESKTKEK